MATAFSVCRTLGSATGRDRDVIMTREQQIQDKILLFCIREEQKLKGTAVWGHSENGQSFATVN